MKYFSFIIALAVITSCQAQIQEPTISLNDDSQKMDLETALIQADNLIDHYLKNATMPEAKNMLAYLAFYRSWYQSVTPAPADIYDALSPNDFTFIEKLKETAKPFIEKPRPMPGASRLSQQGNTFYQQVIDNLKNKVQSSMKKKKSNN
ncbi:MAG: hypothetical protein WA432_03910 [Candidatus Babeliaceae bacterium]